MEYYKLLNFNREPFSSSPDPRLFFRSPGHVQCLQKLEIAVRLHRGLCVVTGEVGTGKTTICRHLLRDLAGDENIEPYLILDPSFDSPSEMLAVINSMFNGRDLAGTCSTPARHREMIKSFLFQRGVDQNKTVLLIIDEGQKLSPDGAEVLRELLNFETNDQKLLQIIIFAQNEIERLLSLHPNFADRVGLFHRLSPLSPEETARFIQYRLEASETYDQNKPGVTFSKKSLGLIYSLTGGYPRKIINLCHNILLTLIITDSFTVTPAIVRRASGSLPALDRSPAFKPSIWVLGSVAAVLVLLWFLTPGLRESFGPIAAFNHRHEMAVHKQHRELVTQARAEVTSGVDDHDPVFESSRLQEGSKTSSLDGEQHLNLQDQPIMPDPVKQQHMAHPGPSRKHGDMGYVEVNKNDALWAMVEKIYGGCDPKLLNEVAGHNPTINNVHSIRSGQRIYFPAVNLRSPLDRERYWVKIASFTTLNQAYQKIFNNRDVHLRVLSLSDSEHGFVHHVVLDAPFMDEAEARQDLDTLPSVLAAQAKVLILDEMSMLSVR